MSLVMGLVTSRVMSLVMGLVTSRVMGLVMGPAAGLAPRLLSSVV
jgi:hypothetical protein